MKDLTCLDATSQAELIRRKEVSPVELVDASIARIESINPEINAVVMPFFDQAREAAANTSLDSVFAGIPFLLKDLVSECAGMPRTDGSAFAANEYLSKQDCELVKRYKRAGFVILGKTNSSEFGLLPTTEPKHYGPTRNPWDLKFGTGGSSGGSSAAVAAGMVAAAHANDGGGSIRIPASCCGLVGLKPTRGRNSLAPNYGDITNGIICEHVVTRSVRDSAAILDTTAGPMPGEPYAPPAPESSFLGQLEQKPKRFRIGLGTVPLSAIPAHQDCIAAAESTARLCEELGHDVEIASPGIDGHIMLKAFGTLLTAYSCWVIKSWERTLNKVALEEHFEATTWKMYQSGLRQSGGDYLLAIETIQKINRQIGEFFKDYDLWLSPTLAQPPVPLGYFEYTPETRDQYFAHLAEFTGFTLIANATGQPGISLPLHWNSDGLPIGVHFTGRYGDEASLISLAGQLEQARPWATRYSALHS